MLCVTSPFPGLSRPVLCCCFGWRGRHHVRVFWSWVEWRKRCVRLLIWVRVGDSGAAVGTGVGIRGCGMEEEDGGYEIEHPFLISFAFYFFLDLCSKFADQLFAISSIDDGDEYLEK